MQVDGGVSGTTEGRWVVVGRREPALRLRGRWRGLNPLLVGVARGWWFVFLCVVGGIHFGDVFPGCVMWSDILRQLSNWTELNTAIAVTAALAAMSCALPGAWLVLRRQSMLGDALAHSALPGVVAAFFVAYGLQNSGWVGKDRFDAVLQICIVIGAALAGLLTAWLTAAVQRLGQVDKGAALGVVFTCLFAAGIVMVRMTADDVHLDPDCALFGVLEAAAGDTLVSVPWLPRSAVANGVVFLVNLGLTLLFFKELRIAAFDAELSNTLGIPRA